jgi:heme/copper-type cytochrome/quinol oxidase subunit 2
VFGIIAMGVFLALAAVTWSYRDVANRHEHKVKNNNQGSH